MAKIKIVDIPPGQAPEEVRKAWVGLILPIAENIPGGLVETGVNLFRLDKPFEFKPENTGGYYVETKVAMGILEKENPEVARWWRTNVYLEATLYFVFEKEVCELLP